MKRTLLILLVGLVAGLISYTCIFLRATSFPRSMEQNSHPELAWLKDEYHLTETQFAAVAQLQDAYRPTGSDGITASPRVRAQLDERPQSVQIAPLK